MFFPKLYFCGEFAKVQSFHRFIRILLGNIPGNGQAEKDKHAKTYMSTQGWNGKLFKSVEHWFIRARKYLATRNYGALM